MASYHLNAIDDCSSDEDQIDVNKMVETKQAVNKIRKDREKKRAQLQESLDEKLADLRVRIKQTVEAHTQQLAGVNARQVDRLLQAVEARDRIDQLIREKLTELQEAGKNHAELLDVGYGHRLDKARSLPTPTSEKKHPQGQNFDRQAKRVKFYSSSST